MQLLLKQLGIDAERTTGTFGVGTSGVGPLEFRGETPRRVEIRLRYRAVFAYSLILAFVRFRDGVAGNGDVAPPGWTCFLGVAAHIHSEMHW